MGKTKRLALSIALFSISAIAITFQNCAGGFEAVSDSQGTFGSIGGQNNDNSPVPTPTPPPLSAKPVAVLQFRPVDSFNPRQLKITIVWSEKVNGFDVADLAVTGATAASISTTDNQTYEATLTTTAFGNVSAGVAANGVTGMTSNQMNNAVAAIATNLVAPTPKAESAALVSSFSTVAANNFLFASGASGIATYDITNPTAPKMVQFFIRPTPRGTAVHFNNSALIDVEDRQITTYTVNAQGALTKLKTVATNIDFTPLSLRKWRFFGNFGVNVAQTSVSFVNFQDPNNVTVANLAIAAGESAREIFKANNRYYLATSPNVIPSAIPFKYNLLNLDNLAAPAIATVINVPSGLIMNGSAFGNGNFVYFLEPNTINSTLNIVSLADPLNPTLAFAFANSPVQSDGQFNVEGNLLYHMNYANGGFSILNIANPVAPVVVPAGAIAGDYTGNHFTVVNNNYFVSTYQGALYSGPFGVARPNPFVYNAIPRFLFNGLPFSDALYGNRYLPIAGNRLLDLANFRAPVVLGPVAGIPHYQDGNIGYGATGSTFPSRFDYTNPLAPVVTNLQTANIGGLQSAFKFGQYLVAPNYNFGGAFVASLGVWDTNAVAAQSLVTTFQISPSETGGVGNGLASINQYAYPKAAKVGNVLAVSYSDKIHLVNLANPLAPALSSTVPGVYKGIIEAGGHIVGFAGNQFAVYSVNANGVATLASTTPAPAGIVIDEMRGRGNYVYVSMYGSALNANVGTRIYDVSNPAAPTVVQTIPGYREFHLFDKFGISNGVIFSGLPGTY